MLRNLLVSLSVVFAAGAAFAAEGDPCDANTFTSSCDGDVITLCGPASQGAAPTEQHFNCADGFYQDGSGQPLADPTLTCVTPACTGAGCAEGNGPRCWGEGTGASCQYGVGVILGGRDALIIGCPPGFSCTLGAEQESCQPTVSACTEAGVTCENNNLKLCLLGNDTATLSDPGVVDCTQLGAECRTEGTFTGCFGGEGALCSTGGFVANCDDGFECVADQTNPAVGTCTAGGGGGEGEGEGEGDGVGSAACDVDADCGRDQKCDSGQCVDAAGDEEKAATCANAGAMAPAAALLVMVAPMFRRRRRG